MKGIAHDCVAKLIKLKGNSIRVCCTLQYTCKRKMLQVHKLVL